MKNAYTAQGNLGILMRMSQLFSGPGSTKEDSDGAQGMKRRDNNQTTKESVQATRTTTQRRKP